MVGVALGATVTTMSKFDPVSYLTMAQECRATHLHFSPPIAVLLAKSPLGGLGFPLRYTRAEPALTSLLAQSTALTCLRCAAAHREEHLWGQALSKRCTSVSEC